MQLGQEPLPELTAAGFQRVHENAGQRAKELLFSLLTVKQREAIHLYGYIPVTSNTGERWRILLNSIEGNCLRMLDGIGYCSHLRTYSQKRYPVRETGGIVYPRFMRTPRADHWIAQLLALQTDQDAFLRFANPLNEYRDWNPILPGDPGNEIVTQRIYW